MLLEEVRRDGGALRAGLDRRGLRRPGARRLREETTRCNPSSPYQRREGGGDLHVPAYVRTFGVNASITRASNTYGPNQYPEKLVPLFVTNALDGEPLPVYGDGRQIRDWLHVEDHCAGVEFVLREGSAGEVYNVGGGNERENLEITQRILELTGADPTLVRHVTDRPGHDRRYSLDSSKLRALGWAPQHAFEEGLAETVEWYRDNRSWWEPIKSGEYLDYYRRQYAERLGLALVLSRARRRAPARRRSPRAPLEMLGALQVLPRLLALAQLGLRAAEVVLRIGLVAEVARVRPPSAGGGALEQQQRVLPAAVLHEATPGR